MRNYTPSHLSHDELRCILAEHDLYNSSNGKAGKQADLGAYIIDNFDFSGLNLSSINARGSVFIRCRFVECDLSGIYFNNSSLIAADFSRADLWKAEFYNVDANAACFDGAKMNSVEFDQGNLRGVTFRNASLRGTSFTECDLTDAVFDGADLENASVTNNIEDGTSWVNVRGRSRAA